MHGLKIILANVYRIYIMDKIRSFRGITLEKRIEECTYYDWNNGKKGEEHKGILLR